MWFVAIFSVIVVINVAAAWLNFQVQLNSEGLTKNLFIAIVNTYVAGLCTVPIAIELREAR